jgi:hypothetical protein
MASESLLKNITSRSLLPWNAPSTIKKYNKNFINHCIEIFQQYDNKPGSISEKDIEIIKNKSDNGYYESLQRNALIDIFFGLFFLWPMTWVIIAILVFVNPLIGIPLAAYEAIPGLGGVTVLGQILYMYRRVIPFAIEKINERKYKKGFSSLFLPWLGFGELTWIPVTILVNFLREQKLMLLIIWVIKRETRSKYLNLKYRIKNIFIKT